MPVCWGEETTSPVTVEQCNYELFYQNLSSIHLFIKHQRVIRARVRLNEWGFYECVSVCVYESKLNVINCRAISDLVKRDLCSEYNVG